eukprot:6379329-Amphidinium_carterae.1
MQAVLPTSNRCSPSWRCEVASSRPACSCLSRILLGASRPVRLVTKSPVFFLDCTVTPQLTSLQVSLMFFPQTVSSSLGLQSSVDGAEQAWIAGHQPKGCCYGLEVTQTSPTTSCKDAFKRAERTSTSNSRSWHLE